MRYALVYQWRAGRFPIRTDEPKCPTDGAAQTAEPVSVPRVSMPAIAGS